MAYRYVIIDDEPLARRGLLKKIEKSGLPFVCVGEAQNGNEGLNLITQSNPDLAILDIYMPQADGLTLLSSLEGEAIARPQILIISGYPVFEYAQQAIRFNVAEYLLKPFSVDEISGSLRNIIAKLNSGVSNVPKREQDTEVSALSRYLYNTYTEGDKEFEFRILPFNNKGGTWLVAELYIQSKYDMRKIIEKLTVGISPLPLFVKVFEKSENEHIYSIVIYAHDTVDINKELNALITPIVSEHKLNCGVSRVCRTIMGLNTCLKEAQYARRSIKIGTSAQIARFKAVEPPSTQENMYDFDMLMYSIESGESERVVTYFRKIYTSALRRNFNQNQLENILKDTYEEVSYRFAKKKPSVNIPARYHVANFLQSGINEETIVDDVAKVFMKAFLPFVDNNIPRSAGLYYEVKYYIDNHYTDELSLNKIADLFHLNPNYVSQLFKTKGFTTFSKYITNLRVEKAKELLSGESSSINSVAKSVGFENEKYFYKVFKKYTGYTPTQYKEMHAKEAIAK